MSSWHKYNHIWITVLLDSLYPLAYGGFLAGIAARLAQQWRRIAVVPAFATIIVDFAENTVQVLALCGAENMLFLKDTLTPIKFGCFFVATILALILLFIALFKWAGSKWKGGK